MSKKPRKDKNLLALLSNKPVALFAFLRITSSISILISPLWGFMAYAFLDIIDWKWFVEWGKLTYKQYHLLDKYLDWTGYLTMIIVSLRYGQYFFLIILGLLIFRFIGQILFLKTKHSKVFLLFPNLFESTFVWMLILYMRGELSLPISTGGWRLLYLLTVIQLTREVYLHAFCPWYLKRYGYPKFIVRLGFSNKDKRFWI